MSFEEFPRHFMSTFPAVVGGRVLVALSGGPDSMALLHLLRHPDLGLELEAAHVHHGVRGTEADKDEAFCRRICAGLGLRCHVTRLQPDSRSPEGRESSWRRLRYRSLIDCCHRHGIPTVATGHQRDDVAEGVLVQLLRGTGPRGLAGIATHTPEGIIRPLLPWSRSEVLAWLRQHDLPWRDDSSNRDLDHLRNLVRHRVLPQLEEHSPRLREHLVNLAAALAEDESLLAGELARRAPMIDPWHPDGGVQIDVIRQLPAALRTRWLHAQVRNIAAGRATRRQLHLFRTLLDDGTPQAITLGRRWRLRAAGRRLWLEPPQPPAPYSHALIPGSIVDLSLPGWRLRLRGADSAPPTEAVWSASIAVTGPLQVRSPRPGDAVHDGTSERPVSQLLKRVLPRHLRGAWPLLCVGDTIAWIPGVWHSSTPGKPGSLVVEVLRT